LALQSGVPTIVENNGAPFSEQGAFTPVASSEFEWGYKIGGKIIECGV